MHMEPLHSVIMCFYIAMQPLYCLKATAQRLLHFSHYALVFTLDLDLKMHLTQVLNLITMRKLR